MEPLDSIARSLRRLTHKSERPLESGAVMVLDDYGFSWFDRQKHAFDEFARAKNVDVRSLPTGQGLIFKP